MTHFVRAFEFTGADLPARLGAARRPVRAHAHDVDTGTLAHEHGCLRVGFPQVCQGWNTESTLPHCARCSEAVTDLVSALVHDAVTEAVASVATSAPRPDPMPHRADTAHHPTVRRDHE